MSVEILLLDLANGRFRWISLLAHHDHRNSLKEEFGHRCHTPQKKNIVHNAWNMVIMTVESHMMPSSNLLEYRGAIEGLVPQIAIPHTLDYMT